MVIEARPALSYDLRTNWADSRWIGPIQTADCPLVHYKESDLRTYFSPCPVMHRLVEIAVYKIYRKAT